MDDLKSRLEARREEIPTGQGLTVEWRELYGGITRFPSYYNNTESLRIEFKLMKPAELSVSIAVGVGVAKDLRSRFTFAVAARTGEQDEIEIGGGFVALRYEDVYLSIGTGADARLALLVDAIFAAGTRMLQENLRLVLRQLGHEAM